MAKIEQRPGGYSVRLSLTDPITHRRTVARITAPTKRKLEQAVAARRVAFLAACHAPAEHISTMTVTEAVEAWMRDRDVRDSTSLDRERLVEAHIKRDPFGALLARDVTLRDVEDWITRKRRNYAPSYVRRMHQLANAGFARLVRRREIPHNPCDGIGNLPAIPKGPAKALSTEQVTTLMTALEGDRLHDLALAALHLGLRVGELLALRWEDCDFDNATVQVRHTMTRIKQDGRAVWVIGSDPKTLYSRRSLHMPLRIQAMLRQRHTAQVERLGQAGEYVFDRGDGSHYRQPQSAINHFGVMVKRAGLPEFVSLHTLRHTWVTHLVKANVPLPLIAKMAGHSSPSITMRVYSHVIDDMNAQGMDALDALYGGSVEPSPRDSSDDATDGGSINTDTEGNGLVRLSTVRRSRPNRTNNIGS